jgi:hypothetical protein
MTNRQIVKKIKALEKTLTSEMYKDMQIREEIHQLKMKLNKVTPVKDSHFDCIGCGS